MKFFRRRPPEQSPGVEQFNAEQMEVLRYALLQGRTFATACDSWPSSEWERKDYQRICNVMDTALRILGLTKDDWLPSDLHLEPAQGRRTPKVL